LLWILPFGSLIRPSFVRLLLLLSSFHSSPLLVCPSLPSSVVDGRAQTRSCCCDDGSTAATDSERLTLSRPPPSAAAPRLQWPSTRTDTKANSTLRHWTNSLSALSQHEHAGQRARRSHRLASVANIAGEAARFRTNRIDPLQPQQCWLACSNLTSPLGIGQTSPHQLTPISHRSLRRPAPPASSRHVSIAGADREAEREERGPECSGRMSAHARHRSAEQ
jgi:hypothetical protein